MSNIKPYIPALLTKEQLDKMHNAALEIIEEVGIYVENKFIKEKISEYNDVIVKNNRIYLKKTIVEKYLTLPKKDYEEKTNTNKNMLLSVGSHSHSILDMDTDKIRPLTTSDLIDGTKLIDAMYEEGVIGGVPGFPQDIHPELRGLMQKKINYQYSRYASSGIITNPKIYKYSKMMDKIMGKKVNLGVFVISPLKLEGDKIDMMMSSIDELDFIRVTSLPIAGISAPISIIGLHVLAIAEVIGSATIISLVTKKPVSFSINGFTCDMKTMNIIYGSPEQNLCDLIKLQLHKYYYGLNSTIGTRSIKTMAKTIGMQSGIESAASLLSGALIGSTIFNGAGQLSLDEIFSPEKLIIDCEILKYVERYIQGFEFSEEELSKNIIKEVINSTGNFLEHDSTLYDYKKTIWIPNLFDRLLLEQWKSLGEKDIMRDKAKDIAKEKIKNNKYELDYKKKEEIEKIYQKAEKEIY